MGYNTHVTGEIAIEPALAWAEFKDSPFLPGSVNDHTDRDVRLRADEESVDTTEGSLVRRTAAALLPRWSESFKAYNLIEHIQEAIDAFPGHEFTGRFDCEGADAGDLWRVVIRDGRAIKVESQIVWPEEGPPTPPLPRRGDATEAWLRAHRDRHTDGHTRDPEWEALDAALEDYRLHADTGTPLGEHACDGAGCECAGVAG